MAFLSGLLSLLGFASQVDAADKPRIVPLVDLNTPVTNPRLVAAINKHQIIHTPETAVELFSEFKRSVFLVGVILEKPLEESRPGEVQFKKGDKFGVIQLKDTKDKNLLALFTDHVELQRWTNKSNSTLVMPAKDAMAFVIEKNYDGLVVNPAGKNHLQLDTPFIKSVMKDM